jgi:hypothetical protein
MKKKKPVNSGVDRRTFVKALPAVGIAGVAASKMPLSALAQTPSPTPPPSPTPTPRVTKEMMDQTEKLIGVELTDAQEAMALAGVNRNLDAYEAIRKVDVPLDTEPAIAFHPANSTARKRSFDSARRTCRSLRQSKTSRLRPYRSLLNCCGRVASVRLS